MIDTFRVTLPHGITLSCRAAGERGRPVLMFLHGFPEAAFVWDGLLTHFAQPEHGGYRCLAPNLRGYEHSSAPTETSAYRVKHLLQDIATLIDTETADQDIPGQLAALVAHDWGGALAWSLAALQPHRLRQLAIINAPHPGTFLRDLQGSPAQQDASAYMNFLIRPDAETRLSENDFRRLWSFFTGEWGRSGQRDWLTPETKERYRSVWRLGLTGGLNYYRTSPLRPSTPHEPAAQAVTLPPEMLSVQVPTLVIWGLQDHALLPGLLEGLDTYLPQVRIERVHDASHWIVHEQPERVRALLEDFLISPDRTPEVRQADGS